MVERVQDGDTLMINTEFAFTFGSIAAAELRQHKANSAILSVDGISSDTGLTPLHAEEAELNRVMMDRSGQTIIVADSTKIDRESFFNFGSLSFDTRLVTDTEGDSRILAELGYHGVQILQC